MVLFSLLTGFLAGSSAWAEELSQYEPELIRGQLRAVQQATLSSGRDGKILFLGVREGQSVAKGDRLVSLDCTELNAQKSVARARLGVATQRYKVNEHLAKGRSISALELGISQAEVDVSRGELKQVEARLSDCELEAPFAAVVTERFADPHEYVQRGDQLLALVNQQELEVDMVIPSLLLRNVGPGTRFSIHVDELQQAFAARVVRIVGSVDPVSQTVRIVGALDQQEKLLLPGMSGSIHLKVADE